MYSGEFLLRHPGCLLAQPFREEGVLRFLFPLATWVNRRGCNAPLRAAVPPAFRTVVPGPVGNLLRGERPAWFLLLWTVAAAGRSAAFALSRPHRMPLLLAFVLLLSSYPSLILVWHGDALDVPRHAVLAGVQIHPAFAVALALACDAVILRWATGRGRREHANLGDVPSPLDRRPQEGKRRS
jgi:hypothetical protein